GRARGVDHVARHARHRALRAGARVLRARRVRGGGARLAGGAAPAARPRGGAGRHDPGARGALPDHARQLLPLDPRGEHRAARRAAPPVRRARSGLRGGIDVEALVERSRRRSRFARPRRPVPTRVDIDNTVSREHTVLDVFTADRVGLLFRITNCLYHLWLEIHLAKITTMVDQVLDVFYVTDHQGRKIEDAARLDAIREELTRALEADGAASAAP